MLEGFLATSDNYLCRLLRQYLSGRTDNPKLLEMREYFSGFDQSRPLEEYEFTVLDTELTDMNPTKGDILEIGAVKIRGMRVMATETFQTLVQPKGRMPVRTTLIHRITPEEVRDAPRLREILPGFLDFIGNSLVVGHHVGLDMTFLNKSLRRVFGAGLINPCLDTLILARCYHEQSYTNHLDRFNLSISFGLKELTRKYGLPEFSSHNALQDSIQTAYLFLFLVRKMRSGQVKTLRDLHRACKRSDWI